MSDLSTGGAGFPANWGIPSAVYNYCTGEYVQGGAIWYGKGKCTMEDVLAIYEWAGYAPENVRDALKGVDKLTICGTDDPAWTTQRDVLLSTNPGGCYKQHYEA